MAPLTMKMI